MAKHAHAASPVLRTVTTRLITALLVALAILEPALAQPRQALAADTVSCTVKGKVDYEQSYKFLAKLNKLRKRKGLGTLTMDATLLKKAEQRAAECSIVYSHTRPDGTSCRTIFGNFVGSIGENILFGYPSVDASRAYKSWKNSPGHYSNMINSKYRACGICCFERDGAFYWVNLFSSTRNTTAKKPANATKRYKVRIATTYLTSKTISVDAPQVRAGKRAAAKVYYVSPISESGYPVPLPTSLFTYKVKSTSIATVTTKGRLTGKKAGKTKLSATLKAKTSCKASTTVIVTQ